MDKYSFDARYRAYQDRVEAWLQEKFFTGKTPWSDLYESMRYSLLAGGKRIRPVLTLEFARLAGLAERWEEALPAACGLELVHTYSLIHDDLPCMDDDDLRRGKPTNHKVYGETMAVLAGDALQAAAYEAILSASAPAERRAACALLLARASGPDGMVAGQVLDTLHTPRTQTQLQQTHKLKTGAMIAAACVMGCIWGAGAESALCPAAETYAQNVGLAFQIRDDMLDVLGNESLLGKPIGSDKEMGKVTFMDLLGQEGCEAEIARATEAAGEAVAPFDESGFLRELAQSLARREK